MPYQSGLLSDFWTRYNQRRALTGRGLTSHEITGLMEPMLAYDAQKAIAAGEREQQQKNFNRQISLQEQAQRDAAAAAKMGGAIQLGGLLGQGYLGYKGLQYAGQQAAATNALQQQLVNQNQQYLNALGGGGGAAALPGAAGLGSVAPLAPASTFTTLGSAGGGGVAPLLGGEYSFAGQKAAIDALAGTTAPSAASAGIGAGPAGLIGAGVGFGASKLLGANEDITQGLTGIGAGAGIGFAVGGPVGAVVGGIIGGAASLIDDVSVICSELLRQGRITKEERRKCILFRYQYIPDHMFAAYLIWAGPIVDFMRWEGLFNWMLLPFTKRFVSYMVKMHDGKAPTLLEKLVWKYAWRRCEKIAQTTVRNMEVA